MMITSLQKALEEYPERLQSALKRQARAEAGVDDTEEEVIDRDPAESTDYQKLKLQYEQKRAQLELKVRQEPMAYGLGTVKLTAGAKPTLSSVDL